MSAAYIITLDEMDLGLLPNTYSPKRNITPLWSLNNELCEFRISYNSVQDQSDKDASTHRQDIKTTMCHICKIDVPVKYITEHRDSVKHKTYLKIADTALQRLRDEINSNVYSEERDPLKYFCPHCTTVSEICDKENHDNSTGHKNAVVYDRYIKTFLDFYTNATDNPNDAWEPQVAQPKPADKLLNAIQKTKQIYVQNNFDIENYLNVLKYKHKMTTNIKAIGKGRLQIDIDGSTLEIDEDNFHGIINRDGGCTECIVCKEIFRNENKYIHIRGSKHAYRVTVPITDVNCIREIYPLWKHCILCNTIIDNYSKHNILDSNHSRNLNTALNCYNSQQNTSSLDNLKPNNEHLNDKKSFVINETSIDGSVISDDTTKNSLCEYCNIQFKKNSKRSHSLTSRHIWNTKSPYHYLYTINTATCRVCDTDAIDVESHVDSEEHKQKYREYLTDNRLVSIEADKFYCMVCFDVVRMRNELLHTYTPNHKKHMSSVTDTDDYYCAVCDKTIKNYKCGIQLHNESKKHKKKIATFTHADESFIDIDDMLVTTDCNTDVKCSLCNILVANNKNSVALHMKSRKHKDKYEQLLRDNIMEVKENIIYCNVCSVPFTYKMCITHLRGKKHIKKLRIRNQSLSIDIENVKETNANVSHGQNNENINNSTGINTNEINVTTNADKTNEIYNSEINLNENINHLNINVKSTINVPGIKMNEAVSNEPGIKMNEAVSNEPGIKMNEAVSNEPGIKMNEAVSNEPGVNKKINKENKAKINENVNKINDSDVNLLDRKMNKFIELFKNSDENGQVLCKICKVRVPLTLHNMMQHLNGARHREKIMEN
ncbi:hypothetical protein KGM_205015 [Danaus plexippus plexippus]|uniref:Uncharacterized protein n=1 Tax=Danaus plexippus plexippus TaxID=278856 RepID=A0A212F477_DANPL|nr:hypothetical protein KGM_205015 [Danaus plexippus plexippus]